MQIHNLLIDSGGGMHYYDKGGPARQVLLPAAAGKGADPMNEHTKSILRAGAMTRMERALLNRISHAEATEWVKRYASP